MFVRAMFNYEPREDAELPCAELGQSFKVGDILEVVDASDFTWWQVCLIHSTAFFIAKVGKEVRARFECGSGWTRAKCRLAGISSGSCNK